MSLHHFQKQKNILCIILFDYSYCSSFLFSLRSFSSLDTITTALCLRFTICYQTSYFTTRFIFHFHFHHLIDGMETLAFMPGRKSRSSIIVVTESLRSPRHDLCWENIKSTSGHTLFFSIVSGVRPKKLVDVNRRDVDLSKGTANGSFGLLSWDTNCISCSSKSFLL